LPGFAKSLARAARAIATVERDIDANAV